MGEAKPTASLSPGLLARKGAARPAMRRHGLAGPIANTHDDLGWNDMGYDVDPGPDDDGEPRIADITPMLSPAPHRAPDAAVEAQAGDDGDAAAEDADNAPAARSPLSVKPVKPATPDAPGKPPVVLEREALARKVADATPAAAPAARGEPAQPAIREAATRPAERAESPRPADRAPRLPATKPAGRPARVPQAAGRRTANAKAAFTLRIDPDRHLRLRLASALTNLSAQQILTEAFDAYLTTLPEVETLAGNVGRRVAGRTQEVET